MSYRIAQIAQPYLGYTSYGGMVATTPCYVIWSDVFDTPEKAHGFIADLCTGSYPNNIKLEKEWFIVIQTF